MPLEYPGEWKFDGLNERIPGEAISDFHEVILKIASGSSQRWNIIERFKSAFGRSGSSSTESWAESDLYSAMSDYANNAALFVDALWSGIENVEKQVGVPSFAYINKLLSQHEIPLIINPPKLVLKRGDASVVESEASNTTGGLDSGHVYLKGDELGRGGYGIVYKVTRKTSVADFEFAMKVLDPSPFNEDLDRALARFRREIKILKQLQHRAIVAYIEAGVDWDGKPYILMPLIEGLNLREAVAGHDLKTILQVFAEILMALDYAHSLDIIHRDLKPSNILVRSSDNQPIIVDFGCAYLLDNANASSLTTTLVGSLGYIPSEVMSNPKLRSPLHDVFACGVMLYEVLAGTRPDLNDYQPLALVKKEFGVLDPVIRNAIAPASSRIESASSFLSRIRGL